MNRHAETIRIIPFHPTRFLILFFSQPYLGFLGVWCGDYELISSIS